MDKVTNIVWFFGSVFEYNTPPRNPLFRMFRSASRTADFLLRTDVLNMGWPKFKEIEAERTAQMKAEYHITEDYYFGAFLESRHSVILPLIL